MDQRETLQYGLSATHTRIHRCLEEISEEDAGRSPIAGLAPIVWQIGHLAWADFGFARRVDGRVEMPAGYDGLFKPGTGGEGPYPTLKEVTVALDRAHQSVKCWSSPATTEATTSAR
jgi:hypothetical protein